MTRRLYRSRTDTVIGGVAAGLATYLNADPALVRIAWAILIPLTGGAAFLAYVVAWIVIPEEPAGTVLTSPASDTVVDGEESDDGGLATYAAGTTAPAAVPHSDNGGRAALVVGIGLVVLGVWFLVRQYLPTIDWDLLWPVVLIGIGGLILVMSMRRRA
jgi:phage shock protein PspC (stress-responsive transcriptional regulator)